MKEITKCKKVAGRKSNPIRKTFPHNSAESSLCADRIPKISIFQKAMLSINRAKVLLTLLSLSFVYMKAAKNRVIRAARRDGIEWMFMPIKNPLGKA